MRIQKYRTYRLIYLTFTFLPLVLTLNVFALSNPEQAKNVTSNIKADEEVVFFDTTAWWNVATKQWHIPIHAWVYEPEMSQLRKSSFASLLNSKFALSAENEKQQLNFDRRVNLLISDNERGKRLVVRIAEQNIILPKTLPNGQTQIDVLLPGALLAGKNKVSFDLVVDEEESRSYQGNAWLIPPRGFSVISDIDDTVKVTEVSDKRALLSNTFFNDFTATDGMPALYQQWSRVANDNGSNIAFHYVSSSPWYLYQPLVDFFQEYELPYSSLSLKAFRFRDQTLFELFKKGTETKPAAIIPLLQRYPQRQFVLVGDSGEQDPEVYAEIYQQFPERIKAVYIRNAHQGEGGDTDYAGLLQARLQKVFANVPKEKWQSFDHPNELPPFIEEF